jgi:hypothetical protein
MSSIFTWSPRLAAAPTTAPQDMPQTAPLPSAEIVLPR